MKFRKKVKTRHYWELEALVILFLLLFFQFLIIILLLTVLNHDFINDNSNDFINDKDMIILMILD